MEKAIKKKKKIVFSTDMISVNFNMGSFILDYPRTGETKAQYRSKDWKIEREQKEKKKNA